MNPLNSIGGGKEILVVIHVIVNRGQIRRVVYHGGEILHYVIGKKDIGISKAVMSQHFLYCNGKPGVSGEIVILYHGVVKNQIIAVPDGVEGTLGFLFNIRFHVYGDFQNKCQKDKGQGQGDQAGIIDKPPVKILL